MKIKNPKLYWDMLADKNKDKECSVLSKDFYEHLSLVDSKPQRGELREEVSSDHIWSYFILSSGIIPKNGFTCLIVPIYKGNEDIEECINYQGITLLICFGKLFWYTECKVVCFVTIIAFWRKTGQIFEIGTPWLIIYLHLNMLWSCFALRKWTCSIVSLSIVKHLICYGEMHSGLNFR